MGGLKGFGNRGGTEVRICPICSKEFRVFRCRGTRYCSRKCRRQGRGAATRKKNLGRVESGLFYHQRTHPIRTVCCPICGAVFQTERAGRKFCSLPCKLQGQRVTWWTEPCPICGKSVLRNEVRKRMGIAIYCSMTCRNRARKGRAKPESFRRRMSGKRNPMYGKPPVHPSPIEYRGLRLRSSYELRFCVAMDEAGIRYEYEPRRFQMADRTYLPDFFLPDLDLWIEVKGWVRRKHEFLMREFRKEYGPILLFRKPSLESFESCPSSGRTAFLAQERVSILSR